MTTFGLILITIAQIVAGLSVGVIVQACIDERKRRRYRARINALIEELRARDEADVVADLLERAIRK